MMTRDDWLTDMLKRDVYKIAVDDDFMRKAKDTTSAVSAILRSKQVFIYAKVQTNELPKIIFMERLGFHLVDTNIIFEKRISHTSGICGNNSIRFALPADEEQVVELARRSISYSRFHQDKNFTKEAADNLKGEWVRGFFTGRRGQAMVIALAGGRVVGFLQLLIDSEKTLIVDLIAVDAAHRRRGIATDMLAYAESNCKGIKKIRVGTQLSNIPSIGFYQNRGFKITEAQYVFHYHNL